VIGETHGHYHVTERIGAGGMGEVYRATDTKLKRDVAIKVLPDEVAQDPDRLARFQREAELLASLNHPHIAAIHGLEEAEGKPLLILELVEGEDLKERLKRGKVPLDEALEIAKQIAEALEEAHAKSIVHRDLKPANVKTTPEGKVKILDFGLAKALAGGAAPGSSSDLSQSPTVARSGTQAGVILGTAAYMSPEQARGNAVDNRADIWAFGAVLFEMLTGEPLFAGETITDLLAAVVKEEPDWRRLPVETPASVRRLLERCLAKDPRRRLRDAGDALLELDEHATRDTGGIDPRPRAGVGLREVLAGSLVLLAVGIAGLAVQALMPGGPTRGPLQLSIPLAPLQLAGLFAVSPDGSLVVFRGRDEDGGGRLYVRALDEPAARGLPGTEDGWSPFFSPDGEWIAFFGDVGPLKKVPTNGGPVVTVTEGNFRDSRGMWTEDGWIVLTQPAVGRPGELLRVRSDGGALEPLTVSEDDALEFVSSVSKVADFNALLLTVGADRFANPDDAAVAIQSLETGDRHVLVPGGALPRHLANGHIVYYHSGRLVASRLDADGMRLVGTPIPLQGVTGEEDVAYFDVSPDGVLVFTSSRDEEQQARLAWTDRAGITTPLPFDVSRYEPRLSPDGTRVTTDERGLGDVWVWDLDRGTTTRISSAPGADETGTWSPDGLWIAWAGSRPGQKPALYRRRSDGSGPEERLWSDPRHFHVASWTPAGIVVTVDDPTTGWDVLLLDPDDPSEARPLLNATFNESSARVSPDGSLLAFVSDDTGRDEVYVQAFPEPRGKIQVSVDGGVQPVWRPGTREIIYRGSGKIMSVALGLGDPPGVPAPRPLFEDRLRGLRDGDHTAFAVDRDGRLLAIEVPSGTPLWGIRIVLDWMEAAGLRP
jgi:Tol biopolymer transport system component